MGVTCRGHSSWEIPGWGVENPFKLSEVSLNYDEIFIKDNASYLSIQKLDWNMMRYLPDNTSKQNGAKQWNGWAFV